VSGINPQSQAHANLWRAIQEHGGHPVARKYDQAQLSRYQGRIFADANLYANIVELAVEFGSPAAAAAFLISARSIIVAWLQSRADCAVELRNHDTSVTIKGSDDVDKALEVFRELAKKDDA
jgi:hypothetical protein